MIPKSKLAQDLKSTLDNMTQEEFENSIKECNEMEIVKNISEDEEDIEEAYWEQEETERESINQMFGGKYGGLDSKPIVAKVKINYEVECPKCKNIDDIFVNVSPRLNDNLTDTIKYIHRCNKCSHNYVISHGEIENNNIHEQEHIRQIKIDEESKKLIDEIFG